MRRAPRRDRAAPRPGFAAALAVCMLAAVAGLAAGSFYSVVEGRRAAHRAMRHDQARAAADVGLARVLDGWGARRYDSLPVHGRDSAAFDLSTLDSARVHVHVTRITNRLFLVTAAGASGGGTSVAAARGHQLLIERLEPVFPAHAALVSRGGVLVGSDTRISGVDAPPRGWVDCPPADTSRSAAVVLGPASTARRDDGGLVPNVRTDSTAADPLTYEVLGNVSATSLATRADIAVPPGAILSPAADQADCQLGSGTGSLRSWGDPFRTGERPACERLFPVVHAAGDLTVTSGVGQGVLLVDGRLRIEGPFLFAGVVISKGGIDVTGSDVNIYGAVLSGAGNVSWLAGGELQRSTCAVKRVAAAAAKPYPVPRRSWAELF